MKQLLKIIKFINHEYFLKSILFILVSFVLIIAGVQLKSQIPQDEWNLLYYSDFFLASSFLIVSFFTITLIDLIFFTSTFEKVIRFSGLFILANAFTVCFYFYFFNNNIIAHRLYFHCFVPIITFFMIFYCAASMRSYYKKFIYKTIAYNDLNERIDIDNGLSNKTLYIPAFELKEHRTNKTLMLFVYPRITQMPWGAKVKKDYFVPESLSFYQDNLLIIFEGKTYIIKPVSQDAGSAIKHQHSEGVLEHNIQIIPSNLII